MSKDRKYVYAIWLKWEGDQLKSKLLRPKKNSKVYMLGVEEDLEWRIDKGILIIDIPPDILNEKPCEHAWVFKIEI